MENKPITCVMTYRGVEGFPQGLYEGVNRDVLIAGTAIPREDAGGYHTVPINAAREAYQEGITTIKDLVHRIDTTYIYFGARGSVASLETVERLPTEARKNLKMVACDCGGWLKQAKANELGIPLIWSECGGRRTLAEIVQEELNR